MGAQTRLRTYSLCGAYRAHQTCRTLSRIIRIHQMCTSTLTHIFIERERKSEKKNTTTTCKRMRQNKRAEMKCSPQDGMAVACNGRGETFFSLSFPLSISWHRHTIRVGSNLNQNILMVKNFCCVIHLRCGTNSRQPECAVVCMHCYAYIAHAGFFSGLASIGQAKSTASTG